MLIAAYGRSSPFLERLPPIKNVDRSIPAGRILSRVDPKTKTLGLGLGCELVKSEALEET